MIFELKALFNRSHQEAASQAKRYQSMEQRAFSQLWTDTKNLLSHMTKEVIV